MAIRLFRCRDCGHRLRYGARNCGKCGHPTPDQNQVAFVAYPALVLVLMIVGIGLLV